MEKVQKSDYERLINKGILDYSKYKKRIKSIINSKRNKYQIKKNELPSKTLYGLEIEKYSIGNGKHHIVVVGGMYGNEIISVDFVTRLMNEIAKGKVYFDSDFFTIDFFPLLNPEGFFISTLPLNKILSDDLSFEQKINNMNEYMELIKLSENSDIKLYQKTFDKILLNDDNSKNKKMIEQVRRLCQTYNHPLGSIVDWRSNASGVNLKYNNPENPNIELIKKGKILYGSGRASNIKSSVPGPLGTPCTNCNNFKFEKENLVLMDFISKLYNNGNFYALFNYCGNGRNIVCTSSNDYEYSQKISYILAKIYAYKSDYQVSMKQTSEIEDLYRYMYPNVLTIPLLKEDEYYIDPYMDFSEYLKIINTNVQSFYNVLDIMKDLVVVMYKEKSRNK